MQGKFLYAHRIQKPVGLRPAGRAPVGPVVPTTMQGFESRDFLLCASSTSTGREIGTNEDPHMDLQDGELKVGKDGELGAGEEGTLKQ